jgi:hypothetical protein
MTPETHYLIQRLSKCVFAPATAEKRFIRELSRKPVEAELTERQLLYLGQVAYRYRGQLDRKEQRLGRLAQ